MRPSKNPFLQNMTENTGKSSQNEHFLILEINQRLETIQRTLMPENMAELWEEQ